MVPSEHGNNCPSRAQDDGWTCTIRCGIPALEPPLARHLEAAGLRPDAAASTLLLIDIPSGFALRTLESPGRTYPSVLVETENTSPEYWEDLWSLQPAGLIAGIRFDQVLVEAIARVARGERYRATPDAASPLTAAERTILHYLARGWTNRRIAHHLHQKEQSVRNLLTTVYAKLGLANRVEAALYYWGREDLFDEARALKSKIG